MATVIRTIGCKLYVTAEQATAIDDALDRYADACNAVADTDRDLDSTNRLEVHHACYRAIRQRFGLSANHVIHAIARTCIALKVPDKADSTFRPTALDLDACTFRFHEADWTFGVTLLNGRVRFTTLLGEFQRDALKGKTPTRAVLVKRREGGDFLHVQIAEVAPETLAVSDHREIDLGVVNLAVASDGQTFSGEAVEAVRRRYSRHRRGSNQWGTKSARRRLCKVRRREANCLSTRGKPRGPAPSAGNATRGIGATGAISSAARVAIARLPIGLERSTFAHGPRSVGRL